MLPIGKGQCYFCDRTVESLKACSRCRCTFYCSAECQKSAWPEHKSKCKDAAASSSSSSSSSRGSSDAEIERFPDLESFGMTLFVPTDAKNVAYHALSRRLKPMTVFNSCSVTGKPMKGVYPGTDRAPVLHIGFDSRSSPEQMPFEFFILGPCHLTRADEKELTLTLRRQANHACVWPDYDTTRRCPVCRKAAVPGSEKTLALSVQILFGKGRGGSGAIGCRAVPRLFCEGCVRSIVEGDDLTDGMGGPRARGQRLYDGVGPAHVLVRTALCQANDPSINRAEPLWNTSKSIGFIDSIQMYYSEMLNGTLGGDDSGAAPLSIVQSGSVAFQTGTQEAKKFEKDFKVQHGGETARVFQAEKPFTPGNNPTEEDERLMKGLSNPDVRNFLLRPNLGEARPNMHTQEFHITQSATARSLQAQLAAFWETWGAEITGKWKTMKAKDRKDIVQKIVSHYLTYFDSLLEQKRKGEVRNHVEDIRKLIPSPLGKGPAGADSFLPEIDVDALASVDGLGPGRQSVIQLLQERAASNCVAKDVAHVARLASRRLLPRLEEREDVVDARGEKAFLLDYLDPFHPDAGLRAIVLIGSCDELTPHDAADAELPTSDYKDFRYFTKKNVIGTSTYSRLTAPLLDRVQFLIASPGTSLPAKFDQLVREGAATPAAVYVYAADKQYKLFEFIKFLATNVADAIADGFDKSTSAYKQGLNCFVCSQSRNKVDGSRLFACAKCQQIFYCSKECQVADWPRHKRISCVNGTQNK